MTEQELMDMKLHETISTDNMTIIRVIGGWLYVTWYGDDTPAVFVPEPKKD